MTLNEKQSGKPKPNRTMLPCFNSMEHESDVNVNVTSSKPAQASKHAFSIPQLQDAYSRLNKAIEAKRDQDSSNTGKPQIPARPSLPQARTLVESANLVVDPEAEIDLKPKAQGMAEEPQEINVTVVAKHAKTGGGSHSRCSMNSQKLLQNPGDRSRASRKQTQASFTKLHTRTVSHGNSSA